LFFNVSLTIALFYLFSVFSDCGSCSIVRLQAQLNYVDVNLTVVIVETHLLRYQRKYWLLLILVEFACETFRYDL